MEEEEERGERSRERETSKEGLLPNSTNGFGLFNSKLRQNQDFRALSTNHSLAASHHPLPSPHKIPLSLLFQTLLFHPLTNPTFSFPNKSFSSSPSQTLLFHPLTNPTFSFPHKSLPSIPLQTLPLPSPYKTLPSLSLINPSLPFLHKPSSFIPSQTLPLMSPH